MRRIGLLLGAAALVFFGVNSHALAGSAADPVCVSPAMISAEDQKVLDAQFPGFKSVIVATMDGPVAQAFAGMLAANGAPDTFKDADTIVVLNALPPEGDKPMSNRHVVAFKNGCEVANGFVSAAFLAKLIGQPA